ncbi:MAG TPA: hypothetical protein VFF90_13850, partial [Saprospiraceae bacterium]|nr:hypothetical protein [Saprospiraceae bacterium]
MKRIILLTLSTFFLLHLHAQNVMTPELLWKLGRVSALGITKDGKSVIYSVSTPNAEENKSSRKMYSIPLSGGAAKEITTNPIPDKNISPDGQYMLSNKEVQVLKITGKDKYPDLSKSNAYVFDDIAIRHWDTWEEGAFDHVFVSKMVNGKATNEIDIMKGQPYDCPQKPFGGDEDYIWHPDSRAIIYCTKQKVGKEYATSTNTDLFLYELGRNTTTNLTEGRLGYDINPAYSVKQQIAFLSMKRDGYEADKQDLVILEDGNFVNLTASHDEIHVEGYSWSADGTELYFWAPIDGTQQLFEVNASSPYTLRQVTKGDFDITGIVGQAGTTLIVSRT